MNDSALWQPALPLPGHTSYKAEDYAVTPANELAHRAVMGWPDWAAPQMALIGPTGSGRTHLAHVWAEKAAAQPLTLSSTGEAPPAAVLEASPGQCFWLDDAEQADETTLFHLLNLARERHLPLLLTATGDFAPALPDLASRWKALPKSALLSPDDTLLKAVLLKKLSDLQLKSGPEVIEYLARRLPRTLRHAVLLVEAMDRLSLEKGRGINLPTAREALERTGFS